MKILLDEFITEHPKPHLPEHEVYTVREMKWSGIKNGKLISLCVEQGIELLLSIDKTSNFSKPL